MEPDEQTHSTFEPDPVPPPPASVSSPASPLPPVPAPNASLSSPRPALPTTVGAPAPIRMVAFEPKALRRSTVLVLFIVTFWLTAVWIFQRISGFLFLLLLAWLFAMAMEPAIRWLVERRFRRTVAVGIVGGTVILAAALLMVMFGNLFITQLSQLLQALPGVVTELVTWANKTFSLKLNANTVATSLSLTPNQVGTMASNLAGGVLGIVTSLLSAVLDAVTFVVFSFYLAADGPRVRRAIASRLSKPQQEVFVTVWDIAVAKTGGYVVSKLQLAALSWGFHAVFFYFIGVPYWLPLSLLVGILAQFVPVLGTYVGILVPVLFVVFTQPFTALWIVLFASVYQQIETYIFTPRISKRTMDINSGIALGAVFVGAAIWGAIGALIAIPVAAAAVAILDTYGHRHELVPALALRPDTEEIPPTNPLGEAD